MWIFGQPSSAARIAVIYITVGALTVIWTAVWFLYLHNNPPETDSVYYWCGGFLATGLTLIGIGFGLGQIGRSARHADLPAHEVTEAVVNTQPAATAPVAVVPPPNSMAAVLPNGPAVHPAQVNQVSRARVAT